MQICTYQFFIYCSVALVVDDTTLLNRLLKDFPSRTTMQCIVLLWGDKNVLDAKLTQQIPIFTFKEIIELGQDSLQTILGPGSEGDLTNFYVNFHTFLT